MIEINRFSPLIVFENQENNTCKLLELDFSIKCQITGKIPFEPSRTSQCKFLCVVEKNILEEVKICSCGREVEKF